MEELLHWIWTNGVFYTLYFILIVIGLWTTKSIIELPFKERFSQWQYLNRLRKIRATEQKNTAIEYENRFLKHIYLLIKTTSKQNTEMNVVSFLIVSTLLFLFSTFIVVLKYQDAFLGVILGTLVSIVPYMMLHIKLRKLRFLMGNEFLPIVHSLTQNYNANHYDMYYALRETQQGIEDKHLRKVMIKLVSDLQVARNESELRMSVQVFVYTAGTSWAKRLGNIIIKSYLYNENVLKTLLILTKQIEDTEEMLEQEQSTALDTVYNGYFTLVILLASLVLGFYVSGAQDWVALQFEDKWSLLTLTLSSIGVVFSLIISSIVKRPKNDL
ncbi:hypothetical protein IQ283_08960 (plasmid) [Alkalihalobacillus hwajinpoensis]|uniref:hypothetical protein n=1 Tax=Guptibacillus hwajinpoensis TaxID=208199 RepID=UPI00188385A8|nr:hypothetical protein [Pseudalkalibacillus hwajinpoensis]MBF0706736.1 hypothetical protein [Pseudalkalibacillus hwajinpoensis]